MSDVQLDGLRHLLAEVRSKDRHRLARQLERLERNGRDVAKLLAAFEQSVAWVRQRRDSHLDCAIPAELPIAAQADRIRSLLQHHQVVIVAGETGSGKSTQLPKICLAAGRGTNGTIAHTQPRRVAARSVAARIAEETGTELGTTVGYRVRFGDQTSEASRLVLMTDGLLLAEIQRDRFLSGYDTIIIDEAHERSLNIDFLIGYLKQLVARRPDLKVIITSATIDVERFSAHFDEAPVVCVEGRTYPVEVHYREPEQGDLPANVLAAITEILDGAHPGGDILVFLPGERDIRETARLLRQQELRHVELLPLYARLSLSEQGRVFSPHTGTRIVLATNVAETSLTVPGIRFVVDSGLARISRYSVRSKVQRLPIEPISRASADQRAGRCGRVGPGICYRLFTEEDLTRRAEFTDPEIRRTNLASVILRMLDLRLGDIEQFPFLDPPDTRQVNDGFALLADLRLIDADRKLTARGKLLSALPVDPRLGAILLGGCEHGSLREMLIIAAALSVQDPRERPPEQREQADQAHAQFRVENSDFLGWVNLWERFEEIRQESGTRQQRNWCERHFVHWMRMREWRDIHRQLRLATRALGWHENQGPADYASVHRALLQGFATQVGVRDPESGEYVGERNRRFALFPGSTLKRAGSKWVVAAEFLDTGRLFGVTCARVEPDWIVQAADHLLQREHHSPRYDRRRGQVVCRERLTLRGLLVAEKGGVDYSRIDADAAHEIFVRECLAEWNYPGKAPFYLFNLAMRDRALEQEAKLRRPTPVSDPERVYGHYRDRIPTSVCSLAGFEQWRKKAERDNPKLLCFGDDFAAQEEASAAFPDAIEWQGNRYSLAYSFDPGHERDGVVMRVPLALLHQIPVHLPEWLVPGLLAEKCEALLKALPKSSRRRLVPIPATVARVLPELHAGDEPLSVALARAVKKVTGEVIDAAEIRAAMSRIAPLYNIYFELCDERGKRIAGGRDLVALKSDYRDRAGEALAGSVSTDERANAEPLPHLQGLVRWEFGELPEYREIERGGNLLRFWPGLVDAGDSVELKLFDTPDSARRATVSGVCRLLILNAKPPVKYLSTELLRGDDLSIRALGYPSRQSFVDELLIVAVSALVGDAAIPRDAGAFDRLLDEVRGELVGRTLALEKSLLRALKLRREVEARLESLNDPGFRFARRAVSDHVHELFGDGFVRRAGAESLLNYPRYLEAALRRIERLPGAVERDSEKQRMLDDVLERWKALQTRIPGGERSGLPEIADLDMQLEEWRISLFAQPMKTRLPVSLKRIEARLSIIENQLPDLV